LFFIPIIPHFNIVPGLIHTDDLPVFLFFLIGIYFLIKGHLSLKIEKYMYFVFFIFYLVIQNLFVKGEFLHSEILRFGFYLFVLIFVSIFGEKNYINTFPFYIFLFLSSFSILSYLFSLNLGKDIYQTWNIGMNLSDIEYIKGRTNGFQAGGPNSFADLITVTGIYSMFRMENRYLRIIIPFSIVGCFFTYSRFSLIVLVLFIFFRIMLEDKKLNSLLLLIGSLLICVNFGLIERFTQDDNGGIQDRVEMQSGTLQYVSEDSIINNIFGRGYDNFVIKGNEVIDSKNFDDNPFSYGPHNSYLFTLLNYGIVGLFLYGLIFKDLILNLFKQRDFNNFSPNLMAIIAFLILSLSSDLLQNHSVSWFFYLSYFLYLNEKEDSTF
tara:strand:- start:328 stop:1470 length:1143 start_codon:yes stop_codon:yes gene_type:complete